MDDRAIGRAVQNNDGRRVDGIARAGEHERVGLRGGRQRAIEGNGERIGSDHAAGRRNQDLLDIVHIVLPSDSEGGHRRIGPRADEGHDKRAGHRRSIGGGDLHIEVVHEIGGAAVGRRLGNSGGIGPAEGGTDRVDSVPCKTHRPRLGTRGNFPFVEFRFGRLGLVGEDDVDRRLYVDQTPTEFVVRSRVAEIIGRMDQQALEKAGAHFWRGWKFARVKFRQQQSRAGGRGRSHARATEAGVRCVA